jgi:hypothetical protein
MKLPDGPLWIRWRLDAPERRAVILSGTDVVAAATTQPTKVRSSFAAAAFDLWFSRRGVPQHWDWTLRGPGGELAVRRTEAPTRLGDPLTASYEVVGVGTIGGQDHDLARPLVLDGTTYAFRPQHVATTTLGPPHSSRAEVTAADGTALVHVRRGTDAVELAPPDGEVYRLDAVVYSEPAAPAGLRLMTLVASLLDTQDADVQQGALHVASNDPALRPWVAPAGVSDRQAKKLERQRSQKDALNARLDQVAAAARARGDEQAAERIEERRQ